MAWKQPQWKSINKILKINPRSKVCTLLLNHVKPFGSSRSFKDCHSKSKVKCKSYECGKKFKYFEVFPHICSLRKVSYFLNI